jgi:hypothetical protein
MMIRWLNLPRDTEANLYMPTVDVNELLRFADGHSAEMSRAHS